MGDPPGALSIITSVIPPRSLSLACDRVGGWVIALAAIDVALYVLEVAVGDVNGLEVVDLKVQQTALHREGALQPHVVVSERKRRAGTKESEEIGVARRCTNGAAPYPLDWMRLSMSVDVVLGGM